MATNKKSNLSLGEVLRTTPCIWLGETNKENQLLLLWNNMKKTHWIIVENNEDNLTLRAPKETTVLSQEIFKTIYEINPSLKSKEVGKVNMTNLPKGLEILSDKNEFLHDKSIKFLSETTVRTTLDNLGVDISKYTYTTIKVDNSHNLKASPVTTGVANYDSNLLPYLFDTSSKKSYSLDPKEEFIMEMLDKKAYLAVIFEGKAGTGKSTVPVIYCAQHDIPLVVTECTQGMDEDSLLSNFIPNKTGGYDLIWGPIVAAFAYGGVCVINEFNYAPAGVVACLHSMIDDSAQVRLHDGTVIKRHKDFRLVLTCNPGYAGTFRMNEATKNRCRIYLFPEITKETLIQRLQVETGYSNKKVLEAIADSFDSIRGIYKSKNWSTDTTYRNAKAFLDMILICPDKKYLDTQFDMAFIYNAIDDMNDIEVEVQDLQDIRKPFLKNIENALADSNGEVTPDGSLYIDQPEYDPDDLINSIGDDGSFIDLEEEVK